MLYILIALAIVITESLIKQYIDVNRDLDDKKEILKGKVIIRKHYNEGAFLNFLEDKRGLVKAISCVLLGLLLLAFAIILPKKGNRLFKLGLSLILGGAISNVSDRIFRGKVVDYFSINIGRLKTVILNLADAAIFIGSLFLLIASLFHGAGSGSGHKA
jgi:signal peptidase II